MVVGCATSSAMTMGVRNSAARSKGEVESKKGKPGMESIKSKSKGDSKCTKSVLYTA